MSVMKIAEGEGPILKEELIEVLYEMEHIY